MVEAIIIGAVVLLGFFLWLYCEVSNDWPTGEKYPSFWEHK